MRLLKYSALTIISLYLLTFLFVSIKYPETLVYVPEVNMTAAVGDTQVCAVNTYYVDFDGGDDANDGKCTNTAWKHAPGDPNALLNPLAKSSTSGAQNKLVAGNTIIFKGGVVYNGRIAIQYNSGSSVAPITYKSGHLASPAWGAGRAVIDGTGISTFSSTYRGLITTFVANYIKIEGLEVRNERNISPSTTITDGWGVLTLARNTGDHDIMIDDCVVHSSDADGINIFGGATSTGRRYNVTIKNSEIYNNKYHGILALEGIDNLLIENNKIHDNSVSPGYGDAVFMGTNYISTAPTNVTIRNNIMYNHPAKGCTLVQGGDNIIIENNYCYGQNSFGFGFTNGAVNGVDTSNVIIRKNIIHMTPSMEGSIRMAGNGGGIISRIRNVEISQNTILGAEGQIAPKFTTDSIYFSTNANPIENAISYITIKNNIVIQRDNELLIPASSRSLITTKDSRSSLGFYSNYNLFYSFSNLIYPFLWGDIDKTFANWKLLGFDINSNNADPLFINPTNVLGADGILWTADDGLIPSATSPACKAGEAGSDIGAYACLASTPCTTYTYSAWAPTTCTTGNQTRTIITQSPLGCTSTSTATTTQTCTVSTGSLSAPNSFTATSLPGKKIKLDWSDSNTNITGFHVERGDTVNGPFYRMSTVAVGTNTYTMPSFRIPVGQTYYFRVRAYKDTDTSPYSVVRAATVQK